MKDSVANTLFQVCIRLTIIMFILTLSIQYVDGMGIYSSTPISEGMVDGDTSDDAYNRATESPENEEGFPMSLMWASVFAGAGSVGLVVSYFTRSPAILGVFVFSGAFWASYINTLSVLNIGNYIDTGFIAIGTAAMFFIWSGAVAGMLSGSG